MTTTGLLKSDYATQAIEGWIRQGRFVPGQKMPSERVLGKELGVSHLTVRRGLESLVEQGLVTKRPRVGNFVSQPGQPTKVRNVGIVVYRYMLHGNYRHPLLPVLLNGASQSLDQDRYNILPVSCTYDGMTQELLPLMRGRRLDGVLLSTSTHTTRDDIRRLMATGVPLVSINEATHVADLLPRVYISQRQAFIPMLEKFASLGHKRLLICQYERTPGRHLDEAVLTQALATYGFDPLERCQVLIPNPDAMPDFSVLASALDRRPTAMIVPDEYAASEIFRLCHRRRLRIPDDLSLVASSNLMPGTQPVPLSCMDTCTLTQQMASHAARVLADLMEGRPAPLHAAVYSGPIQWTESVAPCPPQ